MKVTILGPGCARCRRVEELTREVAAELGTPIDVDHVTDMKRIVEYPIAGTPGLVVEGQVKCSGRIPRKDEIAAWLAA